MDASVKRDISPLLYLVVGFMLGAVAVGSGRLFIGKSDAYVVRDVTVDYMYEYEPNSASGHNALEAASVEFRPGIVLVTETRGRTRVFAIERMRKFSYTPTDPSS